MQQGLADYLFLKITCGKERSSHRMHYYSYDENIYVFLFII